MDTVRLVYRDTDRTPVIYCIKEMARRHYDVDVQVLRVRDNDAYEAALFDGTGDMICEHIEYLYQEVAQGRHRATMFLAPVRQPDTQMVVRPEITGVEQLRGKRIAVRTAGRPYAITMRVRALGLEGSVELVPTPDTEVGRWGQWRRVVDGPCAATFMSHLHLPPALAAGLVPFPAPAFDIVGHFAHACSADYALSHGEVVGRYVKSAIHAACLMKLRRQEALEIVSQESAKLMKLDENWPELERWFDSIAGELELKPYPTPAAIANSYEIACAEWPGGKGINPMALWDMHWVKQADDEGFIDRLIA